MLKSHTTTFFYFLCWVQKGNLMNKQKKWALMHIFLQRYVQYLKLKNIPVSLMCAIVQSCMSLESIGSHPGKHSGQKI